MSSNSRQPERYMRPIANLQEYILNNSIRNSAGFREGKYWVNGRSFTPEEFNELFPKTELKYHSIQLDGRTKEL